MKREVEEVVGLDCSNAIMASAKQGIGIDEILEEVVRRVPPPQDNRHKPLRALIFDSYYDPYKVCTIHLSDVVNENHVLIESSHAVPAERGKVRRQTSFR